MSDTYDTYDVIGEDDGCCCCSDPTEVVVDDWTADEPVVYEADPVVTADSWTAEEPVVHEAAPVVTEEHVAVPQATAVSAAYGPGVVEAPAPTIALGGGNDTNVAAVLASSATVGGTDPYGAMTITDGAGNVADPAVLASSATVGGTDPYGAMAVTGGAGNDTNLAAVLASSATVGGPNAFTQASIGYTADIARFEQLTYGQKMAEMFGGTPEVWEGTPKISLYPTANESVNDISVRSVVTSQAATLLSQIQSAMRNGY